ncbi:8253_t:CDS:2, partial [Diversispora eburnea]
FDAFFKKHRIALEVQGAQHRLHHTSWYKDVKKLEDIVNRDRLKRCVCQDNGIFLLEVWYDEKPEKRKNTLDSKSSSFPGNDYISAIFSDDDAGYYYQQLYYSGHAHMSPHIKSVTLLI